MTLDEFRSAVSTGLTAKFGGRLGKVTIVTDAIHVRPRWLVFAWVDGRAPSASFPFSTGAGDEAEQFSAFMRRVILTLSRQAKA